MTLFLPKGDAAAYNNIYYKIGSDVEAVFMDQPSAGQGNSEPITENDDFIEVLPGGKDNQPAPPVKVKSLPNIETLPRPDALFSTLLPYTVIVRRTGGGVDIESSHQPTLELISEYFRRHSRKNLNDSRQVRYLSYLVEHLFYIFFRFHFSRLKW